jgi:hypothetical protein
MNVYTIAAYQINFELPCFISEEEVVSILWGHHMTIFSSSIIIKPS